MLCDIARELGMGEFQRLDLGNPILRPDIYPHLKGVYRGRNLIIPRINEGLGDKTTIYVNHKAKQDFELVIAQKDPWPLQAIADLIYGSIYRLKKINIPLQTPGFERYVAYARGNKKAAQIMLDEQLQKNILELGARVEISKTRVILKDKLTLYDKKKTVYAIECLCRLAEQLETSR